MALRKLRVYADTSVFGGCFDEEFAEPSKAFFDDVRKGRFILVVSNAVLRELLGAPARVRNVLARLPPASVEVIGDEEEIVQLRDAYLQAGVVGTGSKADAEHVAAASVADVDMILSWNFQHIVHFDKISAYHGVNLLQGYRAVSIYSPREVATR